MYKSKYYVKHKPIIVALVIMLLLSCFILCLNPLYAYAETGKSNIYDKVNVMDDLRDMTIDGKKFTTRDYPYFNYNPSSILRDVYKPKIITMQEYCYSTNDSILRNNYALYLYLYNPYGANPLHRPAVDKNSITVSLATHFNAEGKPSNYETFALMYCNSSEKKYSTADEGDQTGKFYKFRIIDRPINDTMFYDRVNSEERVYNMGDMDIDWVDTSMDLSIKIANKYSFRGYAEGCGPDPKAESNLRNTSETTDVIELNLNQVVYRTKTSPLGTGHSNQLTSVYFSIPNEYINKNGELSGVKLEWFEFETAMGFATSDDNDYWGIHGERNKHFEYGSANGVLDNKYKYGFGVVEKGYIQSPPSSSIKMYEYIFGRPSYALQSLIDGYIRLPCLPFVFKQADTSKMQVGYKEVLNYLKSYSSSYSGNKLTASNADGSIRTFDYNAKLFTDSMTQIPNNNPRKRGYNCIEFFSTDEMYNMDISSVEDYRATYTFWQKLFGKKPTEDDLGTAVSGIQPIQKVFKDDVSNIDTMQNKLYVGEEYASDFQKYVRDKSFTESTYLLRFGLTDYFSSKIEATKGFDDYKKAFVFKQSAFLDTNVIHLRFTNEEGDTVIPVYSKPIDIIGGVTPPPNMQPPVPDWLSAFIKGAIIAVSLVLLAYSIKLIKNLVDIFKSKRPRVKIVNQYPSNADIYKQNKYLTLKVNSSNNVKKKGKKNKRE